MSAALLDAIRQCLVSLKMPCALEELDAVVRRLEAGQINALKAIDALLSEELLNREARRRIKIALSASRLMPVKTLESFDFTFQSSLDRDRIYTLAGLGFVTRAEIVHLFGPPGTGKSHLAAALGVAAVKVGKGVYRCTLADLVDSLTAVHRATQIASKLRFYTRAALLIVDETGFLPLPKDGANLFFQLVSARYEKGAMILTSNRSFTEWAEVFGDPVVATALLDRLLHCAIVVQIEGASYRLRAHSDLIQSSASLNATVAPPKRRGRPPQNKGGLIYNSG